MGRLLLLFLFFFGNNFSFSQEMETVNGFKKKVLTIQRTENPPKIDGDINDLAWQNQPVATNFTERQPENGIPAPTEFRTEVTLLYDDVAVYVMARLYDPEPDKIAREITERDDLANDSFFSLFLNGYNDAQQSAFFIVTAAGVQLDAQISNNREDFSWNAIWDSAVEITDYGWVLEMKIPYRELRFPEKAIQEWGVQFEREVRRNRTRYSWNFVDNQKGTFLQYEGTLRGIKEIKPPVRLSLFPYISSYVNSTSGNSDVQFFGGADIKYGINDAFTLDATLVPDFGQAGFDNVILNLGPFEQRFAEQRQFFIEGTEIFSQGDLFFSRRVGGRPSGVRNLGENEEVTEQPSSVDMLNAIKVSGRTNKGLGVGIFNAITEETLAKVRNNDTGETRDEIAEPFANYNVFVLDQRLKNNSSISLVNTNVIRAGSFDDANVTGGYFTFNNKENSFRYWGSLENSLVLEDEGDKQGNELNIGIRNTDGAHRFGSSAFARTKDYDIDDLGFTGRTDFIDYRAWYGYRYLQPKGNLNNLWINFDVFHRRRLSDHMHSILNLEGSADFNTLNFFSFGSRLNANLGGVNDLFEARQAGQHFQIPNSYSIRNYISTDYRKKYAVDANVRVEKFDQSGRYEYRLGIWQRYRFSDQFVLSLNASYLNNQNQEGFATRNDDEIIIGRRDRSTIENSIRGQYSFNENMILNLNFRHYYSAVDYSDYFSLETNGGLGETSFAGDENSTFNTWNIDMRYSWWYAPGSQLTLLYRNAISDFQNEAGLSLNDNFNRLFDAPVTNNLSLRLTYFLDYPQVKSFFQGDKNKTPSQRKIG